MSISEMFVGRHASCRTTAIAALLLLGTMSPTCSALGSGHASSSHGRRQLRASGNGGSVGNMADTMLAVQGMKCSNSNEGTYPGLSMHSCFTKCYESDCGALIFDSTTDKCKIFKSCSYESSTSTTDVLFLPNQSSDAIKFPSADSVYEVDTHTTCEQPNIGSFEGQVHLVDCMAICSGNKNCKHVVFNDQGDPLNQKCKMFGDCTHKDTAEFLTLFTPAGGSSPPCDPPTTVVCASGSTSEKCLEYCGPNLKAQPPTECGGVIYKCE